jgi:hypothetical protein
MVPRAGATSTKPAVTKPKYDIPVVSVRLPDVETMQTAARMSIAEDKPVMMDYWESSVRVSDKPVVIGVKDSGEKLLVKDEEQYTSPIVEYFRASANDIIVMTENSIYVVSGTIKGKRISA